jgi:predicted AlkP superfamily phosphohydrolase/phosphomutase
VTASRVLIATLAVSAIACRALPGPTGERVLVIGIDAATWDVIRPLAAAGRLPTFARLVAEGWSGPLRSLEPTISPRIWTTIASGKLPEQHGIEGFLAPATDGSQVPVTSNVRRAETLWTIASRTGRTVDVVGWYVTWPVEPVNGVMVADRFVPETVDAALVGSPGSLSVEHPGVYPASLAPDLQRLFVRPEDFLTAYERQFNQQFKMYPVDATRTAIAERLMTERPADLTMVYLWGVDPIQHYFWKYYQPENWVGPPLDPEQLALNREQIPNYYHDVDELLARLLSHTGPRDTVVIISDHGAGPIREYDPRKEISGEHRIDGIIIAAGNHVRHGTPTSEPSVVDVAPTVLYLLGLPAARDMPGRVLDDMIDPAWLAAHPPERIRTYERWRWPRKAKALPSRADDQIKQRLRSLGYIQ